MHIDVFSWLLKRNYLFLLWSLSNHSSHLFRFTSAISLDGKLGFYRNTAYRNKTYSQDVTQLQAIHARQIFPCFDQPDMKGIKTMSLFTYFLTYLENVLNLFDIFDFIS